MFEFITEGFLWGVLWLSVGWNFFPQPEWAKWLQAKVISGYEWAKAQFRG